MSSVFCRHDVARSEVTLEVRQPIVDEVNLQDRSDRFITGELDRVIVVPAVLLERVIHDGIAQYVSNLAARHPRAKAVDHRLGNDIALLDCDSVHARKPVSRAPRDERDGDDKGNQFQAFVRSTVSEGRSLPEFRWASPVFK